MSENKHTPAGTGKQAPCPGCGAANPGPKAPAVTVATKTARVCPTCLFLAKHCRPFLVTVRARIGTGSSVADTDRMLSGLGIRPPESESDCEHAVEAMAARFGESPL